MTANLIENVHLETNIAIAVKQPWQLPTINVIPLGETEATKGPLADSISNEVS